MTLAGYEVHGQGGLRTRPSRLVVAGQTALVVCTVGSLLLTGSRLGAWVYPTLFGVPLLTFFGLLGYLIAFVNSLWIILSI